MQRKSGNIFWGSFTLWGLLGLAAKLIGAIEFTQGVPDALGMLKSFYLLFLALLPFLELGMISFGIVGLIVTNYDFVMDLLIAWKASKQKNWTMPGAGVINYIAQASALSHALGGGAAVYAGAAHAFYDALAEGRLRAAGRRPDRYTLEEVEPKEVEKLRPRVAPGRNAYTGANEVGSFSLTRPDDDSTVFEALLCDPDEVKTLWPQK